MFLFRSRRAAVIGLLGVVVTGAESIAQSPVGRSRAQLESRARLADSLGRTDEATRLRARLRNGDFLVGDRVLASYEGPGLQRADTLVVQSGKLLRLGTPLGDLDVTGLLLSEVGDSIASRVTKYYRDEVVHVVPLLRLSIVGAVRLPGFYYARADMPLGDVIMRTGGADQLSDLRKVTVNRGDEVIWANQEVQSALRDGRTLAALGLEPGDEIVVGSHTSRWTTVLQYGAPIVTALVISLFIRR